VKLIKIGQYYSAELSLKAHV